MEIMITTHETHLIFVHLLIAVLLALVWAHQKLQLVLLQKVMCDVRPKVGARATQPIRLAALVVLRIAPQNVKHLAAAYWLDWCDYYWSISRSQRKYRMTELRHIPVSIPLCRLHLRRVCCSPEWAAAIVKRTERGQKYVIEVHQKQINPNNWWYGILRAFSACRNAGWHWQ